MIGVAVMMINTRCRWSCFDADQKSQRGDTTSTSIEGEADEQSNDWKMMSQCDLGCNLVYVAPEDSQK